MSDVLDTRPPDTIEDAPPAPAPHRAWLDRLALAVPAVAMLVLGFWGLGRDGAMGNDEVATRWISSLSLPAMRHVLSHLDAVHGLYYALIHFWMVFGRSPTAIRMPSLIATVLGVVVVAALTKRLTGSTRSGVAAGLIAATTSSITFYAQTARSYTMVYLVAGLATLVLVRALDARPSDQRSARSTLVAIRPWLLYGALIVLGGYLNELSLLVLGAHLVTVLLARRGRASVMRWLGVSAIAVLLVLPLIRLSQQQSKVLDYLTPPGGQAVAHLVELYFGGATVVAVLVAAVALVGVFARFPSANETSGSRSPVGTLSPATVGLPLLVIPAAVLMTYSLVAKPLYADRYVLFGEIGAAVLAGAGLEWLVRQLPKLRRDAGLLAPSVVLVACVAVFLGQLGAQQVERTPSSRQFDFGGPAAFVSAQSRPGDGVLFFGLFYRKARLGYPADFRNTTDFAQSVTPEHEATFRGLNKPFVKLRPLMLGYDRIWVVGRLPRAGDSVLPQIGRQAHELRTHYVKIEGRTFGKISATLWRRL